MRKVAVGPFTALSQYVSRELWWTFTHLRAHHGWRLVETAHLPSNGNELEEVLERLAGGWPDTILFWESYVQAARYGQEFLDRGTRLYVMTDDLHHRRNGMERALLLADGVLSSYAPRLDQFWPRVDPARVTWMPHAAGPDFLLPMNESPRPVVFVSGAMGEAYPLRRAMRELALRRPGLAVVHEHPGYDLTFDHGNDPRVGRGYALAMQSCLAGFTDALVHQYVVAKHFEIPATGALLVADRVVAPQLADLGFIDGVHYVSATAEDLEPIVERALDPRFRDEVEAIRRRGHALVHARHTVEHRARAIERLCGA
ncbi:MAG TPA: glycosyltransferase [Thermoanaerobaculia bacterium]